MSEAEKDPQQEHALPEGEHGDCDTTGVSQEANADTAHSDLSTEPMCGSNQRAEAGMPKYLCRLMLV